MSWRFRKSIKIAPGVRINFGKSSTSLSIGGKGFHRTYSSTGRVTDSIGIPGTGISYTTTHSSRTRTARSAAPAVSSTRSAQVVPQVPVVDIAAIRAQIASIYRTADTPIDWKKMLVTDDPECHYFKEHAEAILNGDIDAYFEVINGLNPLNDLMEYGSGFRSEEHTSELQSP